MRTKYAQLQRDVKTLQRANVELERHISVYREAGALVYKHFMGISLVDALVKIDSDARQLLEQWHVV